MNNIAIFPSVSLQERLQALGSVTHSMTILKDMSEKDMLKVFQDHKGNVVLMPGKASKEELVLLAKVMHQLPKGKVELKDAQDADALLRELVDELLPKPELFHTFLVDLLDEDPQILIDEYVKYIVGHAEAAKAEHPRQTHHHKNLGFNLDDHEAKLNEVEAKLFDTIPEKIMKRLEALDDQLIGHEHFHNKELRILALVYAMLSNFVRGGAFYGFSSPNKTKDYYPREVAFACIQSWNEKVKVSIAVAGDQSGQEGAVMEIDSVPKTQVYPSPESQKMLTDLGAVTHTMTHLKGMFVEEMLKKFRSYEGTVMLMPGKASDEEKEKLAKVIEKLPEGKVQLKEIDVDELLRRLVDELPPELFYFYLAEVWVNDLTLFEVEYLEYVAGHEEARRAMLPRYMHHSKNMGMDYKKHGAELDRIEKELFVAIPSEIKGRIEALDNWFVGHPYFYSVERRNEAILYAMFDNLVRGGAFYGFSSPDSLEYRPRQIAFDCIQRWNKAIDEGRDMKELLDDAIFKFSDFFLPVKKRQK